MARIRTVKPELFKHEELFDLEKQTGLPIRVAFMGLFTCADREGRFKWRPRALKLDILPYDNVDFDCVLDSLASTGFIEKYEVDGEQYGWIPTFSKHQSINLREAQSTLPAPVDDNGNKRTAMHVHTHAENGDNSAYEYRGVNVAPALRETIIARDEGRCLRCGATEDLTVDHIFPRSIGGTHAPTNLRTLCRPCNSARPVAGQSLIDDLAKDGFTLDDMQRICTHVQAHGEGKGKERKGKEGNNKLVEQKPLDLPPDPIPTIFAYWQKVMNSPKSILDDKRRKLIKDALKNYSPEDICKAIRGCARSPYHMGDNPQKTKYNGLNLILRSAEYIEKFIAIDTPTATDSESAEDHAARMLQELEDEAIPDDGMTIDMEPQP
jgi:hypothetical protein